MKLDFRGMLSTAAQYMLRKDAAFSRAAFQEYLRHGARNLLPQLGWPGIVAIGILAMCIPFYFSTIRPLQERVNMAEAVESSLHDQTMGGSKPSRVATTPNEELDEFYKYFPPEKDSPRWLGKMVAAAEKSGLSLNHGEYSMTRDRDGQLVRFKIALPVQGKYTQIRKFLSLLNSEIPMMALENVQFERKDVLDTDVQVRIRLLLYLVQTS